MNALDKVNTNIDPILASVDFNDGYRYRDFDPDVDQIAAYGIGGLIAGKVLAKAGLFAKLGVLLAKGWKFILIALVAIGGGLKKFFGNSSEPA